MIKISKKDYPEILKLYQNNISRKEIAKMYQVQDRTISNILLKFGISKLSRGLGARKYTFNYNYFDNIDTESKAYILGMLYADGTNSTKRGVLRLGLQEKDIDILEKINKEFDNTKPIRFSKSRKNKRIAEIELVSKNTANQLAYLGCIPKKSLILKFPNSKQVPNHLINHFIRGYFDGDGCLAYRYPKKNKNCKVKKAYCICFVGTELFCLYLSMILKEMLNCNSYIAKRHKHKNTTTRQLWFGGNQQVKRILNYLYKDATIWLDRKYNKYQVFLKDIPIRNGWFHNDK